MIKREKQAQYNFPKHIFKHKFFRRDPNNDSVEYLNEMIWPQHNLSTEVYLDIGNNFVQKHGLFLKRFSIWDGLDDVNGSISTNKINFAFILIFNSLLYVYY